MSEDEFERLKRYLEGHPKVAFYNEGINLIKLYQYNRRSNQEFIKPTTYYNSSRVEVF